MDIYEWGSLFLLFMVHSFGRCVILVVVIPKPNKTDHCTNERTNERTNQPNNYSRMAVRPTRSAPCAQFTRRSSRIRW